MHNTSSAYYTRYALPARNRGCQDGFMAKSRKKQRRATFIKEWRRHRNLNQEQLASRVDLSQETISRLERGDISYTQAALEAIADALNCQPADLIMRPPNAADELRAVIDDLSPETRRRAVAIVKALKDSEAA